MTGSAHVFSDSEGTLWVGTADRGGAARGRHDALCFRATGRGQGRRSLEFLRGQPQAVWIGTVRQGAYLIDLKQHTTRAIVETGVPQPSSADRGNPLHYGDSRRHDLWLGTDGHGIVEVDGTTLRTRRIRHDPTLMSSLADDSVQAMLTDRSGLVWICTIRAISRYNSRQTAIYTVFGGSSRPASLSDSDVDSVLSMSDDRVWLGLGSNGIDVLDPQGLRVAALRPDPEHPATALPKDYVNALVRGPADVYIGTEQGLYRADPLAHGVVRLTAPKHDPSAAVWSLYLQNNVLWVGGLEGLWSLNPGPDGKSTTASGALEGLTDQRVTAIEGGLAGTLWVGTKNGLNHVDTASGQVARIVPDPQDPAALSSGYVATLLLDSSGRLWVGTLGGGICVLDSWAPTTGPISSGSTRVRGSPAKTSTSCSRMRTAGSGPVPMMACRSSIPTPSPSAACGSPRARRSRIIGRGRARARRQAKCCSAPWVAWSLCGPRSWRCGATTRRLW